MDETIAAEIDLLQSDIIDLNAELEAQMKRDDKTLAGVMWIIRTKKELETKWNELRKLMPDAK